MVIRRGLYSEKDLLDAVDRCVKGEKLKHVSETSSIPYSTL